MADVISVCLLALVAVLCVTITPILYGDPSGEVAHILIGGLIITGLAATGSYIVVANNTREQRKEFARSVKEKLIETKESIKILFSWAKNKAEEKRKKGDKGDGKSKSKILPNPNQNQHGDSEVHSLVAKGSKGLPNYYPRRK